MTAIASDTSSATNLYLDLLKRSVLNEIYLDDELRILYLRDCIAGRDTYDRRVEHQIRHARPDVYAALKDARSIGRFLDRNLSNAAYNHSMIGRLRMDNLHECLEIVRREAIPGDLIECGVWRGGSCIFMAGFLKAHEITDRRVFVADSFEGLPPPTHPKDAGLDLSPAVFPQLAVDIETVRENFACYGLDGSQVVYLQGWFKNTLRTSTIERLALLRLDGDLYESTTDILQALYGKVVPGGFVIIDDYMLRPCREAVADFFSALEQPHPKLTEVDHSGVWFRKA